MAHGSLFYRTKCSFHASNGHADFDDALRSFCTATAQRVHAAHWIRSSWDSGGRALLQRSPAGGSKVA
jgi:hypothetical protein